MDIDNKIKKEPSGKRIASIDHARGIGMILVVAGHIKSALFLIPFLYTFHMPLFFFLSGLTFKESKANLNGAKKISKHLLYPYFSYVFFISAVVILAELFIRALFGHFHFSSIIGSVVQIRDSEFTFGLWFLPLLLVSEIMLIAVIRYIKNLRLRRTVIIITLSAGLVYSYFGLPKLPWGIDAAFIAMPFIYLGFESKPILNYFNSLSHTKSIFLCVILLILTLTFCYLNLRYVVERVDMWSSSYGNPVLFILGAVSGILFTMTLVIEGQKWIKLRLLKYVGQNSLHVYCVHAALVFPIVTYILAIIGLRNDGNSTSRYFIYLFLSLCLCLIYVALINYLRPYRDKFINKLSNSVGSRQK